MARSDPLAEYNKKRDFKKTAEPAGRKAGVKVGSVAELVEKLNQRLERLNSAAGSTVLYLLDAQGEVLHDSNVNALWHDPLGDRLQPHDDRVRAGDARALEERQRDEHISGGIGGDSRFRHGRCTRRRHRDVHDGRGAVAMSTAVRPELVEGPARLSATGLGHPLLAPAVRVGNEVLGGDRA